MKQRIFDLLRLYLLWIIFFFISKILFLLFYFNLSREASFTELLLIFWHGLRLDISAGAYLMVIPMLLVLVSCILKKDIYLKILPYYIWFIAIIISLVLAADLELYRFWGFRLDATPLLYIKTPKEALASISLWITIRQLLLAVLLTLGIVWMYHRLFRNSFQAPYKWFEIPVFLFLLAFMIVPIRGGFGIAPINVGSAYFSQNSFINHAAINVNWNLTNSLVDQGAKKNRYEYFSNEEASKLIKPYINQKDSDTNKIIVAEKPNIILIMMESFTANVIQPLGGLPGITPSLNKLSEEGILFTNMYATGDRSDKGLLGILSGYPAQTTFSVIKDAGKTQLLPKLPLDLKRAGYKTSFYYGGDLNFANMRSYLISAGFTDLISMENFPSSTYNSKWGAHDEVVFNKLYEDINASKTPFFKMIFTLSSHEPFEVPLKHIAGNDEEHLFLNSVYYTDSCLGNFIDKAKQKPWWKNTWVIIVADHGIRLPGNLKVHVPEKFHIPMLWLGGVIEKPQKIEKTVSQIDIPVTVLSQLGYSGSEYYFSRDVFGSKQKTDAFYIFNNGVGMVNDSMKLVYDCTKNAVMQSKGNVSETLVKTSKAYLQKIFSDLNTRK